MLVLSGVACPFASVALLGVVLCVRAVAVVCDWNKGIRTEKQKKKKEIKETKKNE